MRRASRSLLVFVLFGALLSGCHGPETIAIWPAAGEWDASSWDAGKWE